MDYHRWHSKWKDLADPLEEEKGTLDESLKPEAEAQAAMQAAYAREMAQEQPSDKLMELKINMALEAYERRRPRDHIMHHYWIREAGDPDAIGEYFPSGDERNNVPVYRNRNGFTLSREKQPMGPSTPEESYGWIIGNMSERRPLYGVRSDDLSAPILGWQSFTAPEPLPMLRYYTHVSAARVFKEKGNRAFQRRAWDEAEDWYSKSLACKLDPDDYAEALAMVLSNRSEVRLRAASFEGAAEDAAGALQRLKVADSFEEPIQMLKLKTVVRLAKAQQSLKRYSDMLRLLQEHAKSFPRNQEIPRLLSEAKLAMRAAESQGGPTSKTGRSGPGASEEMLGFAARAVETVQAQVAVLGDDISSHAFPQDLGVGLKRLEYLLIKAKGVQGSCFSDLQAVMRTCGGVRTLLQMLQAQWKSSLDGKFADLFKLPAVAAITSVLSLTCESCPENLRAVSAEAPAIFSALGSCNRKVDAAICEGLVELAAGLWQHCRLRSVELLQAHGTAAEQAVSFLAKAALAEPAVGGDSHDGPDSPVLDAECREKAISLLSSFLSGDGGPRLERRAVRGAAPQLVGQHGDGLFTAALPAARALGAQLAQHALADPLLVSAREVRNLLAGINLLITSGPCEDDAAAGRSIPMASFVELAGEDASMKFPDLEAWVQTESGQHAALMLQIVAKVLEYRFLLKDRELERNDFEVAFHASRGLFLTIPLVQAPMALAEPALLCLSCLVQASPDAACDVSTLGALRALLGLPMPEANPAPSFVEDTLKGSAAARAHAAKVLSRCVESEVAMDIFQSSGEKAIKELVKLATRLHRDGKGNLESFHDIIHVFFAISQHRPGPLCCFMPEDMLYPLVELTSERERTEVTERAEAIVETLKRDRRCKKLLRPIIRRRDEGTSYDVEEELLKPGDGPGPLGGLG